MKRLSVLLSVAIFSAAAIFASAGSDESRVLPIGSKLDGFSMPDPSGTEHAYKDVKGENGTLIIFLSAQCPVVKMYNERINEAADIYKKKGINVVGIYSNHTESLEWVTSHSAENYGFTVLIDKNNVFADKLGASFTPEVFYFNSSDVLDYHGAIDNDRYARNISRQYLQTALEEKLAGKAISVQDTKAFGCSIKRVQDKQ